MKVLRRSENNVNGIARVCNLPLAPLGAIDANVQRTDDGNEDEDGESRCRSRKRREMIRRVGIKDG